MNTSNQKQTIDASYMRSYASRNTGPQQVSQQRLLSKSPIRNISPITQNSRIMQSQSRQQLSSNQQQTYQYMSTQQQQQQQQQQVYNSNISPQNQQQKQVMNGGGSALSPMSKVNKINMQSNADINRSVSPNSQPRPSTLNQLQQQQQQFQNSLIQSSTTPNKIQNIQNNNFRPTTPNKQMSINRQTSTNNQVNSSYKNSFLDQQIFEQFKDKKIDFQIFANNLVQKLLEFHEKLIPLSKNKYFDVTTLNQYDVVIDDLNQELSVKNQTILDNLDKIKELEKKYKDENMTLKNALTSNKQLQMINNMAPESQVQASAIAKNNNNDQERAFQKEIQCLQGFLEIKLVTFLEQLFVDYHKIILEAQSRNQQYEIDKQHHLKQLYDLQQLRVVITQFEDEIRLLTDTLAQRDVLIYQKQVEIVSLQQSQTTVVEKVDTDEILRLEQTISSQKEIIDSLQEQLLRKPQEVQVEVQDHSRIYQLESEIELLKHQFTEKERYFQIECNNYQTTIEDQEGTIRRLEGNIDGLEETIRKLRMDLQEMTQRYEQSQQQLSDSNNINQELRIEIEEYIEEITNLEQQMDVNDDSKWLAKISILNQEIEQLKLKHNEALIDAKQYMEDNENINRIVDQKSNQIYQLQQQLNDINDTNNTNKMQLMESRKNSTDLQQLNVGMKKELIKHREEMEELQEELRKYENKIRSKTRDIEELRNELENNNNNSRRNENDDQYYQKQINDLTNTVNRTNMDLEQKQDQINKANRENNKLQFDVDQQKDYIENLEKQVKKQRSEMESKIDELDNTEKKYKQAQDIYKSGQGVERKSIMQRKSLLKTDVLNFGN